jgi:hypothetical protein
MKYFFLISAFILLLLPACNSDDRKKALDQKEAELNRLERELQLKQQSLALKEEELAQKERSIDSVSIKITRDTLAGLHPGLPGLYNVTMRCTETTCPGSAVGDTKTEQWQLVFENNQVIVNAMSGKKLVRVYMGGYVGNTMELLAQTDTVTGLQTGNMVVRLQETRENRLRGMREITRQDNCRIIYDLDLEKQ